ncbi:hypothetical protein AAMO2058_000815100 [Amorphochlora amoebiformis]
MVFSGIVQEMGRIVSLEERDDIKMWDGKISKGTILVVEMKTSLKDAYIGCSIAINGVCLTVTEFDEKTASFGLAPETLRRSNLKHLQVGDPVNIEPSLKVDDRNSGHYVQGHVDGTGEILSKTEDGDSLRVRIGNVPADLMLYIVEKGYIAVDGTSLTITGVDQVECWFEFMLISHTQSAIIIPKKEIGEYVNIEVDIMAKYSTQRLDAVSKELRSTKLVVKGSTIMSCIAMTLSFLALYRSLKK